MPKIHVLLKKEELDNQRLEGKVVVVLDILFATTSIVAAIANGAKEVVPLPDGKAALAEAEKRKKGTYILSGELNADTLPGFCHPTPLALLRENVAGRAVLYCTTNGTVAVHKARHADQIYAAALVNGRAVVERILKEQGDETVLIVCSGSADNFNLEDFYGAGHFVALFSALAPGHYDYTDAAIAAETLYAKSDAIESLKRARIGRLMLSRGLDEEIAFAAQQDCFDVVPKLVGGVLRAT
ncbi:MAG TPA: 2-phosphosulfolactate phosphatase [Burkholderiales bacterium]